jgi:hypothetical protein
MIHGTIIFRKYIDKTSSAKPPAEETPSEGQDDHEGLFAEAIPLASVHA